MLRSICFTLISITGLCLSFTGTAQQPATEILDGLHQRYPSEKCLKIDFSLTYENPEGEGKSMDGRAWRMKDKYRIELPEQWIVSDGETLWNYLRDIDEIHIENAQPAEEGFNPANFISFYKTAGYIPGTTMDKQSDRGHEQHISFKPEDKNADIVKARIELVDTTPRDVWVLYRNGMKTHIEIESIQTITSPEKGLFVLDRSQYPDAYIEDLRLD